MTSRLFGEQFSMSRIGIACKVHGFFVERRGHDPVDSVRNGEVDGSHHPFGRRAPGVAAHVPLAPGRRIQFHRVQYLDHPRFGNSFLRSIDGSDRKGRAHRPPSILERVCITDHERATQHIGLTPAQPLRDYFRPDATDITHRDSKQWTLDLRHPLLEEVHSFFECILFPECATLRDERHPLRFPANDLTERATDIDRLTDPNRRRVNGP